MVLTSLWLTRHNYNLYLTNLYSISGYWSGWFNIDSIEVSMVYQLLLSGYQPKYSLFGLHTSVWRSFRRGQGLNPQVYQTPPVFFQDWPNGSFYGLPTIIILLSAKTFLCQLPERLNYAKTIGKQIQPTL